MGFFMVLKNCLFSAKIMNICYILKYLYIIIKHLCVKSFL
jgi:hypothetical protein